MGRRPAITANPHAGVPVGQGQRQANASVQQPSGGISLERTKVDSSALGLNVCGGSTC